MSDIFVSYSSDERDFVTKLVAALHEQQPNWSLWWDTTIAPGSQFSVVIERELKAARCVIVVWSKSSVKRDWVLSEAEQGRKRGVLIPVLIEDVDLPIPFDRIQAASLVGWAADPAHPGFRQLVDSIAAMLGQPAPAVIARKNRIPRWAAILASALLVLLGGVYVLRDSLGLTRSHMVFIPGGTFTMGSTAAEVEAAFVEAKSLRPELLPTWKEPEVPDHPATLAPFYIDRYGTWPGGGRPKISSVNDG